MRWRVKAGPATGGDAVGQFTAEDPVAVLGLVKLVEVRRAVDTVGRADRAGHRQERAGEALSSQMRVKHPHVGHVVNRLSALVVWFALPRRSR